MEPMQRSSRHTSGPGAVPARLTEQQLLLLQQQWSQKQPRARAPSADQLSTHSSISGVSYSRIDRNRARSVNGGRGPCSNNAAPNPSTPASAAAHSDAGVAVPFKGFQCATAPVQGMSTPFVLARYQQLYQQQQQQQNELALRRRTDTDAVAHSLAAETTGTDPVSPVGVLRRKHSPGGHSNVLGWQQGHIDRAAYADSINGSVNPAVPLLQPVYSAAATSRSSITLRPSPGSVTSSSVIAGSGSSSSSISSRRPPLAGSSSLTSAYSIGSSSQASRRGYWTPTSNSRNSNGSSSSSTSMYSAASYNSEGSAASAPSRSGLNPDVLQCYSLCPNLATQNSSSGALTAQHSLQSISAAASEAASFGASLSFGAHSNSHSWSNNSIQIGGVRSSSSSSSSASHKPGALVMITTMPEAASAAYHRLANSTTAAAAAAACGRHPSCCSEACSATKQAGLSTRSSICSEHWAAAEESTPEEDCGYGGSKNSVTRADSGAAVGCMPLPNWLGRLLSKRRAVDAPSARQNNNRGAKAVMAAAAAATATTSSKPQTVVVGRKMQRRGGRLRRSMMGRGTDCQHDSSNNCSPTAAQQHVASRLTSTAAAAAAAASGAGDTHGGTLWIYGSQTGSLSSAWSLSQSSTPSGSTCSRSSTAVTAIGNEAGAGTTMAVASAASPWLHAAASADNAVTAGLVVTPTPVNTHVCVRELVYALEGQRPLNSQGLTLAAGGIDSSTAAEAACNYSRSASVPGGGGGGYLLNSSYAISAGGGGRTPNTNAREISAAASRVGSSMGGVSWRDFHSAAGALISHGGPPAEPAAPTTAAAGASAPEGCNQQLLRCGSTAGSISSNNETCGRTTGGGVEQAVAMQRRVCVRPRHRPPPQLQAVTGRGQLAWDPSQAKLGGYLARQ